MKIKLSKKRISFWEPLPDVCLLPLSLFKLNQFSFPVWMFRIFRVEKERKSYKRGQRAAGSNCFGWQII